MNRSCLRYLSPPRRHSLDPFWEVFDRPDWLIWRQVQGKHERILGLIQKFVPLHGAERRSYCRGCWLRIRSAFLSAFSKVGRTDPPVLCHVGVLNESAVVPDDHTG